MKIIVIQICACIVMIILGLVIIISLPKLGVSFLIVGCPGLIYQSYLLATYKRYVKNKQDLPQLMETFIENLKNGNAIQLPNPKEIQLIPPRDVFKSYNVILNGKLIGETIARTPFVFSTSLIKNVLYVESPDGQKSLPLFFEIMSSNKFNSFNRFLCIGLDSHRNLAILLSHGLSSGIKKLKPSNL